MTLISAIRAAFREEVMKDASDLSSFKLSNVTATEAEENAPEQIEDANGQVDLLLGSVSRLASEQKFGGGAINAGWESELLFEVSASGAELVTAMERELARWLDGHPLGDDGLSFYDYESVVTEEDGSLDSLDFELDVSITVASSRHPTDSNFT